MLAGLLALRTPRGTIARPAARCTNGCVASPRGAHRTGNCRCVPRCWARRAAEPGIFVSLQPVEHILNFTLNIPRGDGQQAFMAYLNSALRRSPGPHSSEGVLDDDGSFKVELTGAMLIGELTLQLRWRLKNAPDGTLLGLEAECIQEDADSLNWQGALSEFVVSVMANALSARKSQYFRRSTFFYVGEHLDGEYWIRNVRFAPGFPDDPYPFLGNAERVVVLDQTVLAIDEMHASLLADERARTLAARLSFLLNTGLYPVEHTQRWVWPVVDGIPAPESIRMQLGFAHPSMQATAMPAKGETCRPGQYSGSLMARYRLSGQLLSLPAEARKILRMVDAAAPIVSEAFDSAARLHHVGAVCGRLFRSVELAYRVAAVEAASRASPNANSFGAFMRQYVKSPCNLDAVIKYAYGPVRSGHFHAGEFPMGEYRQHRMFDLFMDADDVQQDGLHRTCYEVTREAIVNWLTELLPEPTDAEA